jgi:hypothetical protein
MNPTYTEERSDTMDEQGMALLPGDFAQDLRRRWDQVQAGFVDEPRRAVQQADELVGSAIDRLSQSFSEQRKTLEGQWGRGDDVSTEDLRQALRRYRAFFQRLLAV